MLFIVVSCLCHSDFIIIFVHYNPDHNLTLL